MRRSFYKGIVLIVLFCSAGVEQVQTQEVAYKHIGINEGLPSTEIYSLLTDSKGYLWLSSDAGVCRFNGREFTCFTTADGIKDNTVFNLFEDHKGRVWMTCYNGGVCYYENGKINSIAASDSLIRMFKGGLTYVYSSAVSKGDTLWLGTNASPIIIPPHDNYGRIIVDTAYGDSISFLIRMISKNRVVTSSVNPYNKNERKIRYAGEKWSFCIQGKGGLNFAKWSPPSFVLNTSPSHRSVVLKDGYTLFSENNDVYIISPLGEMRVISFDQGVIFLDRTKDGSLWIGLSRGGVLRYARGDLNEKPEHFFSQTSISGVVQDLEGGTWMSSLEKGLYFIPQLNYSDYKNVSALNEKIAGLDAIGNKVFVANNNSQIYMLDINGKGSWLTKNKEVVASRSTEFYHYNNKVLISSNSTGEIDSVKKTINHFVGERGRIASSIGMVPLGSDSYLILSGGQLLRFQDRKYTEEMKIPSRANCIFMSGKGDIYLGARSGLMKIEDKSVVPAFPGNSIFKQAITCIEEGKEGWMYFGTKQNGVVIVDGNRVFSAGISEGLPSDICNAVYPDTSGYVWIGTNKGVSFVRITNEGKIHVIANLNRSHGLLSNEITRITRRGPVLYVGTKDGLASIDVSKRFYNEIPPPVYIRSVSVNKISVNGDSVHIFGYDDNDFRFDVDCISYKDLFSPAYEYRLQGYDSLFQRTVSGFIEYSNLPPGEYKFEVVGLNNNGVRSVAPAFFSFSIAKPFWLTWWFILSEIAAGAAIVWWLFRIRLNVIRKDEEEKTRINTMIAESQMTALRSQMNPHFIFNAINSIQNYILKENTQQAYDYLAKFSKLIRMVLGNSKENMLTLEQELATLSLYMELELMRFNGAFTFVVNVDKQVDTGSCYIPGMLLQPFVENAIWHGIMPLDGSRQGKVELDIKTEAELLIISITDNGIGRERSRLINKSATHKSVGMLLSRNRLEILNKSSDERKYSIVVEDLHDKTDQPTGTKVIITIPILFQDEN